MTSVRASGAQATGSKAPAGRDEVVAAILAAAAELFAERGPAATSIRDIATKSNVNHGLVFRHFGAKEKLIGAVLDEASTQLTRLIDEEAPPDQVQATIDRQWRVMARALLDGYPAAKLQTRFPMIERLLATALDQHASEGEARMAVANAVALQLGWRLFEPFLRIATDIEDVSDSQLQAAVSAETARILQPHQPHTPAGASRSDRDVEDPDRQRGGGNSDEHN